MNIKSDINQKSNNANGIFVIFRRNIRRNGKKNFFNNIFTICFVVN